jgi:hypothetical protein
MAIRTFRRGRGPTTFQCQVCERMTRDTGQGVDHLCEQCFDIAGLDNMVNDEGYKPGEPAFASARRECDALLEKAVRLGSNGDAIKQSNTYIWCLASDFETAEPPLTAEPKGMDVRPFIAPPVVPAELVKPLAELPVRKPRKLYKVAIEDGMVYQNGVAIAHMGRGSMVYITAQDEKRSFIARFKYARPSSKARKFVRTVFARLTLAEYLARYADGRGVSPADIEAQCEGYASSLDRYQRTHALSRGSCATS